jgi:hypothetical protein
MAVATSEVVFPVEAISELRTLANKVGDMAHLKRLVDVLAE